MNLRFRLLLPAALIVLSAGHAGAQVLDAAALKKAVPDSFFFAGQSAPVQMRNAVGLKNSSGKLVLAAMVDTSGYSTAVAERYQGLLITETSVKFGDSTLEPGAYGFGFSNEGKFTVMNIAGTDVFSVGSKKDDELKRAVPLKLEKEGDDYRLYAGKKYVVLKAD